MKKYFERLYNGIVKENPTLILMLGMCPTLAVSTRAMNGIGMGLSTTAVLILSNLVISLLRKTIPDEVRLPAYIVIVASLVTVTELLIEAYLPSLYFAPQGSLSSFGEMEKHVVKEAASTPEFT